MKEVARPTLIVVVGPTAVGKTSLAIQLAKEFNAEIISADSRQFFKEISIGTAKPTTDELSEAKHHFIGNISIEEEYNASKFEKDALAFLNKYFKKNKVAILCGGSGMYVNALLNGFDENVPSANEEIRKELNNLLLKEGIEALQKKLLQLDPIGYETIDIQNPKRLLRAIEINRITGKSITSIKQGIKKERFFNTITIGLELPRPLLYQRINDRVDQMLAMGLEEEAKKVYPKKYLNSLKTVGYTELFNYFDAKYDLAMAIEKIKVNSRRYAKRQLTWFKKSQDTTWFSPYDNQKISMYIRKILFHNEQNS